MTEARAFTTTDAVRLEFTIDDYTDPRKRADTGVQLHAAITNGAPERGASDLREFLLGG